MSEKFIKVPVEIPGKGKETLLFKKGVLSDPKEIICEAQCSYSNICENLPDPEHPEDADRSFTDFCGTLTNKDEKFKYLVPVEGSLEKLGDTFQELIKKNPVVRLNDVIDCICQGGFCDDYTEDHVFCNSSNNSCILKSLLKNKKLKQENQSE